MLTPGNHDRDLGCSRIFRRRCAASAMVRAVALTLACSLPLPLPPTSVAQESQIWPAAASVDENAMNADIQPEFISQVDATIQSASSPGHQPSNLSLPVVASAYPIRIDATQLTRWEEGAYDVIFANGQVSLQQGGQTLTGDRAIIWIDWAQADTPPTRSALRRPNDDSPTSQLIIFMEGNIALEQTRIGTNATRQADLLGRLQETSWFGRLRSSSSVSFGKTPGDDLSKLAEATWQRAKDRWQQEYEAFRQANFQGDSLPAQADPYMNRPIQISPQTGATTVGNPVAPTQSPPMQPPPRSDPATGFQPSGYQSSGPTPNTGASAADADAAPAIGSDQPVLRNTRVQITPRQSTVSSGVAVFPSPVPGESIITSSGGVRIFIDSQEISQALGAGNADMTQVVIEADSVVAWTNQYPAPAPDEPARWELYLEGNVEFVLGDRVAFAERMYYDAINQSGTILDVELLTPVEQYRGLARLKADVIEQVDRNTYLAYGAATTSSRLGVPRYWLQSESVQIDRVENSLVNNVTGLPLFDANTGEASVEDEYFMNSQNNFVYLNNLPVFYWPRFRTSLNNPSYYIENLRFGNDRIFGTQFIIGLDAFQVLGIQPPNGVDWRVDLGFLSRRGPVLGSEFEYHTGRYLGVPGDVDGRVQGFFINDTGLDSLGRQRRNVTFDRPERGRLHWTHQHIFSPGFRLQAELGYISDRNLLEQYFEREWDQERDQQTGLWLLRNINNQSFHLSANARINDIFTQTGWLPRFDHYILGQPVFGSALTWHGHSHVGYGRFDVLDAPTDPRDAAVFGFLPWETADARGVRAGTRHQLDLPFQAGPARLTPYVLGDVTYWDQDLTGSDVTRVFGQTGIRSSLPMWRADPTIQNTLLNLNGLAHKVTLDSEVLVAQADQGFGTLPLYDPLDDDSQEHFRRRFIINTFGGVLPPKYDERFFAFRSAIQSNVASPTAEIANDLAVVKLAMRNRWQTKRGLPGEARIVDVVEFDIGGSYFPNAVRDNFGTDFGMLNYDYAWHIGDRLSLVSDGFFEVFSQGLRTTSVGVIASRPGIGNIGISLRSIEGPISANILSARTIYRMSDKWIFRGNTSFDFSSAGNIGQALSFVRVGESFLVSFGVNVNSARDNVGFTLGFEPRFLPKPRLGLVGGEPILPASALYLE